MLEPRKRTALDGKVWWCVFDTNKMEYNTILFGKYKLKRDCQYAIDRWNIRKEELKCKHIREDGICLNDSSSTGRCDKHCSYYEH